MSNQLELRHIKYFLAVAEELHFRKAADRLFISQPGLSRQIKQMETELGIQLFERHNRKVALTQAGVYLRDEYQSITKSLNKVQNHAQLLHKGQEGELKIGYIGSAMHKIIPSFLLDIKKKYPNIHVNLQEMDNQVQTTGILDQDIDIGFVRMDRVPRGVEIQPIYEETFSLVLPKKHSINKSNFKGLSQLKDEPFIMFDSSYSPSYYEKVMQIFDEAGFVPIISHKSVKANTIYRLIENNLGAAIVPTSLQQGYDLDIQFIELTTIEHRTTLQMVWSNMNQNPVLGNVLGLVYVNNG
ncbi:MAG: DNA-binding transcriptional LysR family regulator [Saprospiraceae bacterium]|jgi:DNA-binding transcriptional LysR family regulator